MARLEKKLREVSIISTDRCSHYWWGLLIRSCKRKEKWKSNFLWWPILRLPEWAWNITGIYLSNKIEPLRWPWPCIAAIFIPRKLD